tara:strand:- start:35 stop:322 length:288 start_codon:yes stop_codon:yes gene_type:complete
MPITEDKETLRIYLQDGKTCTIENGIVFPGHLDTADDVIAGGTAISTEYILTAVTEDVSALSRGSTITVDSVKYTVRENLLTDDGSFSQVLLSKT